MARLGTKSFIVSGARDMGSNFPMVFRCLMISVRSYVIPLGVITGSVMISNVIYDEIREWTSVRLTLPRTQSGTSRFAVTGSCVLA